jgi:hypothetical protein
MAIDDLPLWYRAILRSWEARMQSRALRYPCRASYRLILVLVRKGFLHLQGAVLEAHCLRGRSVPRKTRQEILVEALDAYLARADG